MNQTKNGFTLIELVMVIIILSILAAFSLPKFVNLKTTAIDKTEEAIMGSLNVAIKAKYSQNIASGMLESDAWPCQDSTNPFTLLEQVPPYQNYPGGFCAGTQDNYNWRTFQYTGEYHWRIYCPHWNGSHSFGSASKGRLYMYQYGVIGNYGHNPGDFFKYNDYGH